MGRCMQCISNTFLEMIPKIDFPNFFEDFGPVSLCNGVQNIMAKLIENKINPFLLDAITQENFGFVKGRLIHEDIGYDQEGTHLIKIHKKPI
jgi:hypothetical protein